jgi:arylsulfatase A
MHSVNGMFAIRAGSWKLEEGLGSGGFSSPVKVDPAGGGPKGQLYDLSADPEELQNLYQVRPDIVNRLSGLLAQSRTAGHTRPLGGAQHPRESTTSQR